MWWQYAITILSSVISGALVLVVRNLLISNDKLRKQQKEESEKTKTALENGVMSLLKIQLIEYHDKYMIDGNIPNYVYDNWNVMYNAYRDLGGNGMVEHMNEEIHKLELGDVRKHEDNRSKRS